MAHYFGRTNWDYLKILVGPKFKVGMSEYDMWRILAGPLAKPGDLINDLIRKWAGNLPKDGYSNWDWIRLMDLCHWKPGDSINDLLRELVNLGPCSSGSGSPPPILLGPNLIPPGSTYDKFSNYVTIQLTPGATYYITLGANNTGGAAGWGSGGLYLVGIAPPGNIYVVAVAPGYIQFLGIPFSDELDGVFLVL